MPNITFGNDVDISGSLKIVNATGNLDLDRNEIQNAIVHKLATEPSSPSSGVIFYNTTTNRFGYYNGSAWIYPNMSTNVYDTNANGKVDIAENAELLNNQSGSYYLNRSNHTGTQPASSITNFTEEVQDAIGSALIDTNSVDFTYDDVNNQIKADVRVISGGGIEIVTNGIQLTNTGVSSGTYTKVTVDVKGRITSATQLSAGDLPTHTHTSSNISDFTEAAQDAVGGSLIDTNSIDFTYDDANNQIKADVKIISGGGIEIVTGGIQLTNTGVSSGTYTKVTVDGKGRVTAGAQISAGDLPSHTHTASNITDFDTAVRANRLDQMATPTSSLNLGSQRITNLADPQNAQDAATKNYVDNAVAGLSWKMRVKCATTTNITLSGAQTIDGVSVTAGDRVLVKNQSTQSQNGIYVAQSGSWVRADDANTWDELVRAAVFVEQGNTQANTGWVCTINRGGNLGSDPVTWTQFTGASLIIAGEGLSKNGNQLDVNVDNQSIEIASDTLQAKLASGGSLGKSGNGLAVNVDNNTIVISSNQLSIASAYRVRKVVGSINGNGTATQFDVTHDLGTKDVKVEVYDTASTCPTIYPLIERTDTNRVRVSFKRAPANGVTYNVVIVG